MNEPSQEILGASGPLTLASEPARVSVPLSGSAEGGKSVGLVVDGIDPLEGGSVNPYEVYVNLPSAGEATQESPHFVGFLDFYGAAQTPGASRAFDITSAVQQLTRTGGWDPATAEVTFMPGRVLESGAGEATVPEGAPDIPVRIGQVRLTAG